MTTVFWLMLAPRTRTQVSDPPLEHKPRVGRHRAGVAPWLVQAWRQIPHRLRTSQGRVVELTNISALLADTLIPGIRPAGFRRIGSALPMAGRSSIPAGKIAAVVDSLFGVVAVFNKTSAQSFPYCRAKP